jgi:hypothetical protein
MMMKKTLSFTLYPLHSSTGSWYFAPLARATMMARGKDGSGNKGNNNDNDSQ